MAAIKTVKMYRMEGGNVKEADVHPDEVTNFGGHGWVEKHPLEEGPNASPEKAPKAKAKAKPKAKAKAE